MSSATAVKPSLPNWHQPPQPSKKKKKNAPDKPQPTWLFPPDEENPVLNPKPKTEGTMKKEKEERDHALEYMKRRVHAVPDRPAPPHQLLTLVGIFLTEYGFNSTSRLFTNERRNRQVLNGWEDRIGTKLPKGTPSLEQIYRDWSRGVTAANDETSSDDESGSEESAANGEVAMSTQEAQDSSDSDADSDVEMVEAPKPKKTKTAKRQSPASSSSSLASSDSDADDEGEKAPVVKKAIKQVSTVAPTVTNMINKLKRKASPSESESSSDGAIEDEEPKTKKPKILESTSQEASLQNVKSKAPVVNGSASKVEKAKSVEKAQAEELSSSSSESSSDSDKEVTQAKTLAIAKETRLPSSDESESDSSDSTSSSESDADVTRAVAKSSASKQTTPPAVPRQSSTSSSATINGDSKKVSESSAESSSSSATSDSSSDTDSEDEKPPVPVKETKKPADADTTSKATTNVKKEKKPHKGAQPTPLAALSQNADPSNDKHLSNEYKSYEYADKAYKDLSVTRGKGFTKEKNKKKRGSYRGGTIDVGGGKAYKFED